VVDDGAGYDRHRMVVDVVQRSFTDDSFGVAIGKPGADMAARVVALAI